MDRQRIAIFGSTGQLGTELVEVLRLDDKYEALPLAHADCDSTDAEEVSQTVRELRPDVIINCSAYVRVDDCEDHAWAAFEVNAIGALNIARACAAADALCVYISTDYIFDGDKGAPYVESDPTHPINVYGASKLAGEHLVQDVTARCLIVRTSSLFGKTGARGKGGNFVQTVIDKAKAGQTLRIVDDVTMSPTYARDVADALTGVMSKRITGRLHLTNSGACTWYEFGKAILDFIGLGAAVVPISSQEYASRARRPKNSALRSERTVVELRSWQDAVKAYLLEKGHLRKADKPWQTGGRRSFADQ